MYQNIIFDLDGTLWDAAPLSAKALSLALNSLTHIDHEITTEHVRAVSGKPFSECNQLILSAVDAQLDPDEVLKRWDIYEREHIEAATAPLYPAVAKGIQRLSKQYALFLISNCQDWYLDVFWARSGLRQYFTDWNCHGVSQQSKTAMIKNMIVRHQLVNSVYVGDTLGDQQSATQAGIDFIYAAYGFGSVADAKQTFTSFNELVSFFNA